MTRTHDPLNVGKASYQLTCTSLSNTRNMVLFIKIWYLNIVNGKKTIECYKVLLWEIHIQVDDSTTQTCDLPVTWKSRFLKMPKTTIYAMTSTFLMFARSPLRPHLIAKTPAVAPIVTFKYSYYDI